MKYVVCTCSIISLNELQEKIHNYVGKMCFGNIYVGEASFSNYVFIPDFSEVSLFHCVICIPNDLFIESIVIGNEYQYDIIADTSLSIRVRLEKVIIREANAHAVNYIYEGHFTTNFINDKKIHYYIIYDNDSNPLLVKAIVKNERVYVALILSSSEFSAFLSESCYDKKKVSFGSGRFFEIDTYKTVPIINRQSVARAFGDCDLLTH